jgi:hypothetical protein
MSWGAQNRSQDEKLRSARGTRSDCLIPESCSIQRYFKGFAREHPVLLDRVVQRSSQMDFAKKRTPPTPSSSAAVLYTYQCKL